MSKISNYKETFESFLKESKGEFKESANIRNSVEKAIKEDTQNAVRGRSQTGPMRNIASEIETALNETFLGNIKKIYEHEDFAEFLILIFEGLFEDLSENKEFVKGSKLDSLSRSLSNPDEIAELKSKIRANELANKRAHLLFNALDLHLSKNYIASIPLLLSQIEGLIWDYGVYKKRVDDAPNSKAKLDSDGKIEFNNKGNVVVFGFSELLVKLFGDSSKLKQHIKTRHNNEKEKDTGIYSTELRHPILHGRKIDYDTERNATILLIVLMAVLEKIEHDN